MQKRTTSKRPRRNTIPKATPPKIGTIGSKRSSTSQLLTGLGFFIAILGLIVWWPRLSSSASPPLDLSNQLASSRFTVTNDGYLPVTDVMSACFLWELVEGGLNATSSMARVVMPAENTLRPTEGYTVPCTSENMIATGPPFKLDLKSADLAIVVYYRTWPFTFYRPHRLFRFVARVGRAGEVAWDKQPTTEPLEQDYDKFIESRGGTFPPIRRTIP